MENKEFSNEKINNNGFNYVDIGLPSGTLWAACNVGADWASDYGYYFQWGDTQGHNDDKAFCWSDYKWGNGHEFTKYTIEGTKLELKDDAAHAFMGGDWHIPTPDQLRELIYNTENTWTTSNGVKGMRFTSKKDSSKFIFIPAAGNVWNGSADNGETDGFIWASALSDRYVDYAQNMLFYNADAYVSQSFREAGLPVRGVIDGKRDNSKNKKKVNIAEILKNAPKGTKLWSPIVGECELIEVANDPFPIHCKTSDGKFVSFSDGNKPAMQIEAEENVLFPSKNKDWTDFKLPKKCEVFKPFQKVLCVFLDRHNEKVWRTDFYSHYDKSKKQHYLASGFVRNDDEVIPYDGNEDKLGKKAE